MEFQETEQNSAVEINTAAGSPQGENLTQILVRLGFVSDEQIRSALRIGQEQGKAVEQVLVGQNLLATNDLLAAISIQLRVPLIDLRKHRVSLEAIKLIPEKVARKYNVLPLDIVAGTLSVVMTDTRDVSTIDAITAVARMPIEPMMAASDDIRDAININYTTTDEMQAEGAMPVPPDAKKEANLDALISVETPGSIPHKLALLIQQAVRSKASDIHIEPQEDKLQIRYRIDGVLRDIMSLPLSTHAALISRMKVITNMNISERRQPQDGQVSFKVDVGKVDARVATGNTIHGEMAVIRLLPMSSSFPKLTELGFTPSVLEEYQRLISLPFGMILFGGPAGSGKTTTLYASISQLNHIERNIMTIEDPVEYHLKGINQFQVNSKADVRFDNSLRAFMRLDPNVILVGEIRDRETAQLATQAALTGHLILSTIHANNATGVVFRLMDLGVDPSLISSALAGTVAQRIVRRICRHCIEPYEPSTDEVTAYKKEMGEDLPSQFYKGEGCNFCADTGYLGRVAIFEVLTSTEAVRELLTSLATAGQIRTQAVEGGMIPLIKDGMLKVKDSVTTVSEVLRTSFSID